MASQPPPAAEASEREESSTGQEHQDHTIVLQRENSENMNISCDRYQRLLEIIRPHVQLNFITIQIGEADKDTAVATHFPCCLLENDEQVRLRFPNEEIEKVTEREAILPRENYCIFYIETEPGANARTRKLFRSRAIKEFSKLCVYGINGQTFREVLYNDGRFVDDLGEFKLADIENSKDHINCDEIIDQHHQKTFRICYVHGNTKAKTDKKGNSGKGDVAKYSMVDGSLPNPEKIISERPYEIDPEHLEASTMNLQYLPQFSPDTNRLEKLLKLGKSVCKLIVGNLSVGTAFVLFKNYILTNAHLLLHEGCRLDVDVFHVWFDDLTDNPEKKPFYMKVEKVVICNTDMDYAVLKLSESGQDDQNIPNGLMKHFGPIPKSGEACIIGHSNGGPKKLKTLLIIPKENREEEINKQDSVALCSTNYQQGKQNICNILISDKVVTDNTFFYHGSSGSPLFDSQCQVVALLTSRFDYYHETGSVQEMGSPLLGIFKDFVSQLQDPNQQELLNELKEASKENKYLKKILDLEPMSTAENAGDSPCGSNPAISDTTKKIEKGIFRTDRPE